MKPSPSGTTERDKIKETTIDHHCITIDVRRQATIPILLTCLRHTCHYGLTRLVVSD